MNKTEWIEKTAERVGVKKVVALEVLTTGLEIIIEELAHGKKVQLSEFGSFVICEQTARKKRKRSLGDELLRFTKIVVFKGSKSLKDRINSNQDK